MSQAGSLGSSGGGGGSITIQTDDGSVTGSTIPVLGAPYGDSTPVMDTFVDTAQVFIENRTWQTPYVVSLSTTEGERGTFSTIPDAIAQIVADGLGEPNSYTYIWLRPGAYNDPIVIPTTYYIGLVAYGPQHDPAASIANGVIIGGDITFETNSGFYASDITFSDAIDTTNCVEFQGDRCFFEAIFPSSDATHTFNDCEVLGMSCNTNAPVIVANNSRFASDIQNNSAILTMNNCAYESISLGGSTASLNMQGCYPFILTSTGAIFVGNASSSANIFNHTMGRNGLLSGAGSIQYSNITYTSVNNNPVLFPASNFANVKAMPHFGGNVKAIRKLPFSTFNFDVNAYDMYVGVQDTSSAVTISLLDDSTADCFVPGQIVTIKDESGFAATHHILIQTSSGNTINGNGSITITTNDGFFNFFYDGVSWWTI